MIPVKVCGITKTEDALIAVNLGASAIGFIFYPKSPRYITAEKARQISEQLPKNISRVGVFVNPDRKIMHITALVASLTHIQLAGNESIELCSQSPLPVIKTVRTEPEDLDEKDQDSRITAFLIDGGKTGEYGGTGQLGDWNLCRQLRDRSMTILAGGISAKNVTEAIETSEPDAVDISSSLENSPGIKDPYKIRHFFSVLKKNDYSKSRMTKGFFSLV